MKSTFVLAQLASTTSSQENLQKAKKAIAKASSLHHPDVMVFPECFMCKLPASAGREDTVSHAEPLDGTFVTEMRTMAREYRIWLIFGMTELESISENPVAYNTAVVIDSDGNIVTSYRKTHMYDAFAFRESDIITPGETLFEPIYTPFGKIGLFICYELRFPEIARYQSLKGADIIVVPIAWAQGHLKIGHYETLLRARAIENTTYIVASNQCDEGSTGESMVVDPMGVVVARGGEGEELIVAHLDTERVKQVRDVVPSLVGRRHELYIN